MSQRAKVRAPKRRAREVGPPLATVAATLSSRLAAEDTPQSKPAPDPYIRAVERLSSAIGAPIDPRECVAIEDSLWGLQSARAASLRTVAVAHTYEASGLNVADLTIRSINDLDLRTLADLFSE